MSNNTIVMREEEMEASVQKMDKCYTGMDSASTSVPQSFSGLGNAGIFDQGIKTIGNQLNSLTNSIFNVKNVINKRSNEMFNMDRKMAQIAQKIEIPQDFVKNNSMEDNNFNQILLEKLDGKSVNEGQSVSQVDIATDTIIGTGTLKDITNDNAVKEEVYDASTSIRKANINNISNNQGLDTKNIDERTVLSKNLLNNINNMQDLIKQEIDSSSSLSNVILNNINSNNQRVDAQSLSHMNLNDAVVLNDISNSKKSEEVDINSNISAQFDKISATVNELNDDIGGVK